MKGKYIFGGIAMVAISTVIITPNLYLKNANTYIYNKSYDNKITSNNTIKNTNKNINNNGDEKEDGITNNKKVAYIDNVLTNGEPILISEKDKNINARWQLDDGQGVTILGKKGDLYKIAYGSTIGYVNKKYLTYKNNQDEVHENDNKEVSRYFGSWVVGDKIGSTVGESCNLPSYKGKKIIMTKEIFSFNGTTIKNPNYYIVTINPNTYFGSSKYNNFGTFKFNKYGQVEFIVAVAGNKTITNKEFIDMEPFMGIDSSAILVSGDNIATFGGGIGNTSINQCKRI